MKCIMKYLHSSPSRSRRAIMCFLAWMITFKIAVRFYVFWAIYMRRMGDICILLRQPQIQLFRYLECSDGIVIDSVNLLLHARRISKAMRPIVFLTFKLNQLIVNSQVVNYIPMISLVSLKLLLAKIVMVC